MLFKSLFALAAMVMPAFAANIQFTSFPTAVQAGQTYTLTWQTTDVGAVSIILKNGNANNLQTVQTITNQGAGGSFVWTAPTDLADGPYAFEIASGTDVNYSSFFSYTGGTGTNSAAASSAAPSSVASAAASSGTTVLTSIASETTATDTATTTPKTLTTSKTSNTASAVTATATSVPTGAANALYVASPIALVFGAAVAMAIV